MLRAPLQCDPVFEDGGLRKFLGGSRLDKLEPSRHACLDPFPCGVEQELKYVWQNGGVLD